MDAGLSPARQARTHHRHELRTLTYVTLDQANGGIVRNLSHEGMGVQVVAAVRPRQQLRVRFELRYPRLRVETRGEVMWATFSGQCGIRFLDLSPRLERQINEWIFGNLLDGAAMHTDADRTTPAGPRLGELQFVESNPDGWQSVTARRLQEAAEHSTVNADEDDGLMLSGGAVKVIELPARPARPAQAVPREVEAVSRSESAWTEFAESEAASRAHAVEAPAQLDWLSRPLSGSGLAWTVNSLVVVAGLLLFVLVFLVVTREVPQWPFAMTGGATAFVGCFYWGFFKLFGGTSPGTRLARLGQSGLEDDAGIRDTPFR
jgi:hypothetical protein